MTKGLLYLHNYCYILQPVLNLSSKEFMSRLFVYVVTLALALAAVGCSPRAVDTLSPSPSPFSSSSPTATPGTEEPTVPAEYERLYADLTKKLNNFDSYLNSRSKGTKNNVIFAA